MKLKLFRILFGTIMITHTVFAQEKENVLSWEELESRKTPEWFSDAKFGIFIHWGLYSVPAWSPKGTYAEWYQYWLENKKLFGNGVFTGKEVYDYHNKKYGSDFRYSDFARYFKALDFNPDKWAQLFKKAGARYVVLTSKHHEGFALWPSQEASKAYGGRWNSFEIGAHRDLVGEFTTAIRKTNIKLGYYISLREWGNPLYTDQNIDRYVEQHFIPQVEDLVKNYKPDLLWADGPDNYDEETWQTKKLFTWLYRKSPVKDSIVLNDRWAKWNKKFRGDFYTKEYSSGNSNFDKPWEECRGIGFSFGYNQTEDIEDYSSTKALVLNLVNIVSMGGNLLLDVGPDGNGNIPAIMQDRLVGIGEWLSVNGEAVYGSKKWEHSAQWSQGNKDWKPDSKHYVSGDAILKQTLYPDSGYAVKEAFFTKKNNTLYAIFPKIAKTLNLRGVTPGKKSQVSLLGYSKLLKYNLKNDNLEIYLPEELLLNLPCQHAWTIKISNID